VEVLSWIRYVLHRLDLLSSADGVVAQIEPPFSCHMYKVEEASPP
jgi:hypothetical protein